MLHLPHESSRVQRQPSARGQSPESQSAAPATQNEVQEHLPTQKAVQEQQSEMRCVSDELCEMKLYEVCERRATEEEMQS